VILQERYRASERLVGRVVGQHRSTQRHHGGKVTGIEEAKLRHRLWEIALALQSAPCGATQIRWGPRMAYRLLRREGWPMNHKPVQRLGREEGLQRQIRESRCVIRPLADRCVATRLSACTRCRPWTSSSTLPSMGGG